MKTFFLKNSKMENVTQGKVTQTPGNSINAQVSGMTVGDRIVFPLAKYSSIAVAKSRAKRVLAPEVPEWEEIQDVPSATLTLTRIK